MSVRTWVATPEEAGAVADLLIGFRDHLGYAEPADADVRAGVVGLIQDAATEYLLAAAEPEGPPLGVVQLRFRWGIWRTGGDCLVEDVFVVREARGRGLGAALMALATERALARGCRRMELDTNASNTAALALYHGLGFTEGDPPDLYLRRHLD